MTAPFSDKTEDIRNKRKIQIMSAALKVFAESGIKSTKISMITQEAGISHGLLYHYFNSKEEVLHASLEWALSTTEEFIQEVKNLDTTPLGKIREFTKSAFLEGNSNIFRIIQHISKAENIQQNTINLIENTGKIYDEQLLPLFKEAQEKGEIIQHDVRELLDLYLTVLSGVIMTEDLASFKKNIDQKIDIFLRMIAV